MHISVASDVKQLNKKLSAIQRKQIPFTVSQALNTLAFDIRNTVQLALPKYLEASTPYMARGVQVEKFTKQNLVARVGSRSKTYGRGQGTVTQASIMEKQIKGGVRLPKSNQRRCPAA